QLAQVRRALAEGVHELHDPSGIELADRLPPANRRVAFLFPGQGSQQPHMLNDLAMAFPQVREAFEVFDRVLLERGRRSVGSLVFPPPAFTDEERERQKADLAQLESAQPALGAACVGMLQLLGFMGIAPDMVAGHSYGELVALHAAGAFSAETLGELSEAR